MPTIAPIIVALATASVATSAVAQDERRAPTQDERRVLSTSGVGAILTGSELRDYCVYNGNIFSHGIAICARKGIAYECMASEPGKLARWVGKSETCVGGTDLPPPR